MPPAVLRAEEFTDESQGKAAGFSLSTPPAPRLPREKFEAISAVGRLIGALAVDIATTLRLRMADLARRRGNAHIWEFIKTVEEMESLHQDWNGHGSEPPDQWAREMAESILLTSTNVITPNRVAPSAQGGIGICFYRDNKYADIECFNSGEILATTSDGSGRPDVWEVKPGEIPEALKRIAAYISA